MEKITNFHTHTKLCRHAEGMPKDYILQAAKDGCSALGMSDHCPYPKNSPVYCAGTKMEEEEISLYRNEIIEASKLVDFPVYYGFECEWDPEFRNWYEDVLLGKYEADYLAFGCHWGPNRMYIMDAKTKEDFYKWTDITIEGIRSGLYKFIAHPDLFMGAYKIWDEDSKAMLNAILDAAVDCNLPIEINGNGFNRKLFDTPNGKRHPYPYDEFWDIVAQRQNVKVLCNSDAHSPGDVIKWARDAREYAKLHNVKIIDNIFGE